MKIYNLFIRFLLITCYLLLTTYNLPLNTYLYGAAFERIGVGARALGMSGAFTGLGNNAAGIYYNTAGLVNVENEQLEIMYINLYGFSLVSYTFIGYARPNVGNGTISMGLIHLGLGDEFKLRNFSEDTVLLAYGFNLLKNLNSGVALKFYGASYDGIRGTAWSGDIAFLYNLKNILYAGINVQDINSPTIKWETKNEDELMLNPNIGVALKLTERFTITADFKNILTYERTYCVGSELELFEKRFFVRGGISYQKVFSFSFGFDIIVSEFQFQYSMQRHVDLGWNNILGLNVNL